MKAAADRLAAETFLLFITLEIDTHRKRIKRSNASAFEKRAGVVPAENPGSRIGSILHGESLKVPARAFLDDPFSTERKVDAFRICDTTEIFRRNFLIPVRESK